MWQDKIDLRMFVQHAGATGMILLQHNNGLVADACSLCDFKKNLH